LAANQKATMIQFFKRRFQLILILILFFTAFQGLAKAPVLTKKELSVAPPRIIRTAVGLELKLVLPACRLQKKRI
jgi:hypothetical protein